MDKTEHFRIIAWEKCPWCDKAYDMLCEKKKEVFVVFHEQGTPELKEARQKNSWLTVPMITHVSATGEETFIGGYTDLCEFVGESLEDG